MPITMVSTPPASAITIKSWIKASHGTHSASAVSSFTSPPPIILIANRPASGTKAASATPSCKATSGHSDRPLDHQKAGAVNAIAAFSQLSI